MVYSGAESYSQYGATRQQGTQSCPVLTWKERSGVDLQKVNLDCAGTQGQSVW